MEFVPSLWQYQTGKFLKMQEASDLKIKLLFYSRSSTQYSWKQTFLHDTVWNSHKLEQIFVFVKSYSIKISHSLRGTDTKTINSTEQTKVSWIFYGRPYHLHPPFKCAFAFSSEKVGMAFKSQLEDKILIYSIWLVG